MIRDRPGRVVLLAASALALLAAPAAAAAADGWTTVRGHLPASTADATGDGPRVLVAGIEGRRLTVTTLRGRRVVRTQTVRTAPRPGLIQTPRVVALAGGAALVVWQDGGRIASSYRPAAGAPFGPSQTASFRPADAPGVARSPALAAGPGGRAMVAWWGGPAGGRLGIWAADLGPAGTWGAPHEVSAGTYPVLDPPVPPAVAIGAAASPDGGFAVAWRQPEVPVTAVSRRAEVVGATRPAGGDWSAPVLLGRGNLTSFAIPIASPSAGTLIASWADGRVERPDGVTTTTCLVASVLRPGAAPATGDVTCRAQSSPGVTRLVASPDGGVLAAWQVVPDWGPGVPLRAGIELFRLAPGASWTPTGVAVGNSLGYWDLEAFAPRAGGGALLLSDLSQTVRGTGGRQVRAVLVRDDGTVERRLQGPSAPRPLPSDKRMYAVTAGPYRALMTQGLRGPAYLLR